MRCEAVDARQLVYPCPLAPSSISRLGLCLNFSRSRWRWLFSESQVSTRLTHRSVCRVGNIYTGSCRATLPLNANSLRQGVSRFGGMPIMMWRLGRLVLDQAVVGARTPVGIRASRPTCVRLAKAWNDCEVGGA